MRLFFGPLGLILIILLIEIEEASGMRRIWTGSTRNDREGIDHLVTSRAPRPSALTPHPTSLEYQALNLLEHHLDISEPFHQPGSAEAAGGKRRSKMGKGSSSKNAADSSGIDLHAIPSLLTHQAPYSNIPIDTEKKRRSRKDKGSSSKDATESSGIDLNASPIMYQVPDLNILMDTENKEKSRRGLRDLNTAPFQKISQATKAGVEVMHAGFGEAPNVEMEPVQYTKPLTKRTLNRFKKSFEHFQSHYGIVDPSFPNYFLDKFDNSETHGHAAPPIPPNHEGNSGGHASFVFAIPPSDPNPENHFVDYGTHVHAPPSFPPNPNDHSGGSGTSGHADPRFSTHQWGNYGGPESGYKK